MATHNTSSDAANTAVRAFLTEVGKLYLGHAFNIRSGKTKEIWRQIKEDEFKETCAYCGIASKQLQMEHLLMFNKYEIGLHHPGNIVPCCKKCNKRERKEKGSGFVGWEEHLKVKCMENESTASFQARRSKINRHMKKWDYPKFSIEEEQAIHVIANSLFENVKTEFEKAHNLYIKLHNTFVENNKEGKAVEKR